MGERRMKKVYTLLLLLITSTIYSNPKIPTFVLNEFGFNEKGWVIELKSEYYGNNIQLISNTDTSDFIPVFMGDDSPLYVITNDSLKKSFFINPLGDKITIRDSLGWCTVSFSFGSEGHGIQSIIPGKNQSISLWQKPLGKTFYYLDNSSTFGFPNDSVGAVGTLQGIIKDSLGHPIPNLKVYYDYETYYGGGDIYTTTDDSGHFSINDFAEYLTLKFKRKYFYDDKVNVQIYPDSTINLSITINTDILSSVELNNEVVDFHLEQNYPNPFNPITKIRYIISEEMLKAVSQQNVILKVYDILGNEVTTLLNEIQSPGNYEIEFDASKYNLSSGLYFYVLKSGGIRTSKKMCLLK
jgi:hypothetical protein